MALFLKLRLRKVLAVGHLRRFALWFGAVALGIGAIALLVVNLYVQSHEAQARIQQELSRRLGTSVKIRSVSVTPWGGLTLSGITIAQPPPATAGDFLEARSFHLHVRFLPLFSRHLIIKEVSLLGPNVVWSQEADGKWHLPGSHHSESVNEEAPAIPDTSPEALPPTPAQTGEPSETNPPVAQASPSQQEARGSAPVFVPEMRRINISDGNFRFFNRSGGSVATFDGVRFHSAVRNQAVRGNVAIEKISLRDRFFLQDLKSSLHYDAGALNLQKISARSGGGDVSGDFILQSQAEDSPFNVAVKFRGIQADEIVTQAGGPKGIIQGELEGSFEANGKSADAAAVTGHGEIFLRDGQLQQYSLLVALGQILQIEELTRLQLQQAEAKYHIDPGVVTIDQLVLRSPNIRVSSTGTVGFDGKLRLQSQLAINDKIRERLFNPIRDNFQPIDEPGYAAVDFQVTGTIDRPKTNLMERVVGRNLKDFVNGLLGGGKPDKPKRKKSQNSGSDLPPSSSPEPTRNPDARTTPP